MNQHVRLLSPRCKSHVYIYPEEDHQLESRMREIRLSGSEGGAGETPSLPYREAGTPAGPGGNYEMHGSRLAGGEPGSMTSPSSRIVCRMSGEEQR